MRITALIWLDYVIEKLALKHSVRPEEVKQVLGSSQCIRRAEKGHRSSEDVYAVLGQTDSGRCLIVFFVCKSGGRALVLSARDMTRAERRMYGEK